MLICRKSSTDDEYHHEDPLAVFGVITGATGAVLSSNVYDAFMAQQYVPVPSKHPAKCYIAMSEPNMLTGSGGRGVAVPSRGFQVMGKKPKPAKKLACKKQNRGPMTVPECISQDSTCENTANYVLAACLAGLGGGEGLLNGLICRVACAGALLPDPVFEPVCIGCLVLAGVVAIGGIIACFMAHSKMIGACHTSENRCINTGYWY